VNELRRLRRNAGLSQREFAERLDVPLNTFRMWDSGLRRPPAQIVAQAREALAAQARQRQLLPLAELAKELGVHVRTLQAAARTGRLETQFSVRSVFGRPIRRPRAPPVSGSSPGTTAAFVGRRHARRRCRLFLTIMTSGYETCGAGKALRKTRWLDALGPPAKLSSINGNHANERRRRFCGNVSLN
jgi:DNA-binding transcriptional regulator YiaG